MPKSDPHETFVLVTKEARRLEKKAGPPPVVMEEAAQELNGLKRQVVYDKDLHEAVTMAQEFENSKHGKDEYVIREGLDLYSLIHSLIVLWRALKGEIAHGHVEVVPQSRVGKTPKRLDNAE